MNLLSQRTLELNQVILDKMQLEEQMIQIQHELSVLKAENEQLRVQSITSNEQAVSQTKPTLKAGDLARHMGSFKKKLESFVALQGSRR
jgi:prephenate dehydratase